MDIATYAAVSEAVSDFAIEINGKETKDAVCEVLGNLGVCSLLDIDLIEHYNLEEALDLTIVQCRRICKRLSDRADKVQVQAVSGDEKGGGSGRSNESGTNGGAKDGDGNDDDGNDGDGNDGDGNDGNGKDDDGNDGGEIDGYAGSENVD